MSIRLYVGNLPKSDVEREDLQAVFAEMGETVSAKVIKDRKTGKCRGFGFLTVETDEQADLAIEKYNGTIFQELPIKIEKALPKANGEEEGEDSETERPPAAKIDRPIKGGSGARRSGNSGGGKKGGGRKEGGGGKTNTTVYSNKDEGGFQPDPRWAGKLAALKDLLAESGNP
jgi:RNA recognition motif-containing protein